MLVRIETEDALATANTLAAANADGRLLALLRALGGTLAEPYATWTAYASDVRGWCPLAAGWG